MINISRVESRVSFCGHSVPHEKIVERYGRSLDLLITAIAYAHRTYVFDIQEKVATKLGWPGSLPVPSSSWRSIGFPHSSKRQFWTEFLRSLTAVKPVAVLS